MINLKKNSIFIIGGTVPLDKYFNKRYGFCFVKILSKKILSNSGKEPS